jgi:hypothetical protein
VHGYQSVTHYKCAGVYTKDYAGSVLQKENLFEQKYQNMAQLPDRRLLICSAVVGYLCTGKKTIDQCR